MPACGFRDDQVLRFADHGHHAAQRGTDTGMHHQAAQEGAELLQHHTIMCVDVAVVLQVITLAG
jgi:hypothetical protein